MGCTKSKEAGRYFYDHYQYMANDVIGNGANGVVYRCVKLNTKDAETPEDYAVKMVLANEKASPGIAEEILIMRDLENVYVIRLVDWFKGTAEVVRKQISVEIYSERIQFQ